jgi:hypothetical protein
VKTAHLQGQIPAGAQGSGVALKTPDIDPAKLGIAVDERGAWKIGGGLEHNRYRPPPNATALIREITHVPPQTCPPMPRMLQGHPRDSDVREQLERLVLVVWRAVRHREDYPRRPPAKMAWSARRVADVAGAVNVWRLKYPDVSLHALAAVRWDGLRDWSGARPKKPDAVLGRVRLPDVELARAYQAQCEARVLAPTPAGARLRSLAVHLGQLLRDRGLVREADAIGMIEGFRHRADALADAAAQESTVRHADLLAARDRGDWIWTCRATPPR